MELVRMINRRLIRAIWREVTGNKKADLLGSDEDWKFWEGLLAATPASDDIIEDKEDDTS